MNGLALYGRYIALSFRAQMQYPAALIAESVGAFLGAVVDFLALWALFARFGHIQGWRFGEVALFYGVVSVAFAVADAVTRGFDAFGEEFVKTGDFDRLLLRPRPTPLQLLGHELRLTRSGRLAQGLLAVAVAVATLHPHWGPLQWGVLAFAVTGGVALFCGILVLQATLAFWTTESLEVANVLTYGGVEAAQYPLDVYARWLKAFLTYVVPLGCVAYLPVAWSLGRTDALGAAAGLAPFAPAFGLLFLGAALFAWRFGVRHYTSTGS